MSFQSDEKDPESCPECDGIKKTCNELREELRLLIHIAGWASVHGMKEARDFFSAKNDLV